jgi:hypothetical protein
VKDRLVITRYIDFFFIGQRIAHPFTVDGIRYESGGCEMRSMFEIYRDGEGLAGARSTQFLSHPPTDDELDYYVRTGRHPVAPVVHY